MSTGTKRRVRIERGIYQDTTTGHFEITYAANGRQAWEVVKGTKTLARKTRADRISRLAKGEQVVAPSKETVAEVATAWLAEQNHLRRRTREGYETNLRMHVLPRMGRLRINVVEADDVARLIAELRDEGKSESTIRGILVPLGQVFHYAQRRKKRSESKTNPVRGLEPKERPRVNRREVRVLNDEEIRRLIDATTEKYRPVIVTAVYSGLRMGELLGLRWQDVDLDAGLLRVREQLDRNGEMAEVKTDAAKRDVHLLDDEPVRVLREHRERQFARGFAKPDDHVFTTETGKSMSWRNVSKRGLDKAAERAGLVPTASERKEAREEALKAGKAPPRGTGLRFHDLRHVNASMRIEHGDNDLLIADQMGHKSTKITRDLYGHLRDRERDIEEAKRRRAERASLKSRSSTGGDRRRTSDVVELPVPRNEAASATGGDG